MLVLIVITTTLCVCDITYSRSLSGLLRHTEGVVVLHTCEANRHVPYEPGGGAIG